MRTPCNLGALKKTGYQKLNSWIFILMPIRKNCGNSFICKTFEMQKIKRKEIESYIQYAQDFKILLKCNALWGYSHLKLLQFHTD